MSLSNLNIRNQKGFTLAELTVATVIIMILTTASVTGFGRFVDYSRTHVLHNMILKDFPDAIKTYVAKKGSTTGYDKANLILVTGIRDRGPWEDLWTTSIPDAVGEVTITIPLVNSDRYATILTETVTFVTASQSKNISSIWYDAPTKSIKFKIPAV